MLTPEALHTIQRAGVPDRSIASGGADALAVAPKSRLIPAAEAVA